MRAQLISVQFASARECRAGKSFSSELRSSTFEFEQNSRLLCYGVETNRARRDVRQSFEPFAVQPLFGGRREET